MDWTYALLDHRRFDWVAVRTGESGDRVYRREDGLVYAKIAPAQRSADLIGERNRLAWLSAQGFVGPEIVDWREAEEGSCLEMTAVPGIPASELSGADLLKAWSSIARQIGTLHELAPGRCPFDRGLSVMFDRAADVVARNAVNPAFLSEDERSVPATMLLAKIADELPIRLQQEATGRVVCHGDACMPNIMVDPKTFHCTGVIDLGRLGTADRYVDLTLMLANARESWESRADEAQAFAILFDTLGIRAPDSGRLAFYLKLDPLTWA